MRYYLSMRALLLFCAVSLCAAQQVSTLIGNGSPGLSDQQVNNPYGLLIGPDGALYFCDLGNASVRRLDLKTKKVTTIAGNGKEGYSGDGGPATAASLHMPHEIRFDRQGNLYIADMRNHAVRKVDKAGKISTIAGTGQPGFSGDGGPAAQAQLNQPHSIAFDKQGRLLICDIGNLRIRRVDLAKGTIGTYGGTGERKPAPDGATITGTPLNGPRTIDTDPQGNLYLVLREGNMVYKVDSNTGKMTRLAGTGDKGYDGDNGPALQAKLNGPKGVGWAKDSLYLVDTENHAIRRIDLKTGTIRTILGTGQRGDGPEGDPLACKLSRPHGVFVGRDGTVYVGDSEAHRIRVVR